MKIQIEKMIKLNYFEIKEGGKNEDKIPEASTDEDVFPLVAESDGDDGEIARSFQKLHDLSKSNSIATHHPNSNSSFNKQSSSNLSTAYYLATQITSRLHFPSDFATCGPSVLDSDVYIVRSVVWIIDKEALTSTTDLLSY